MRQEEIAGLLEGGVANLVCAGLFGWLLVLLGILISGVIVHLFLMLFGGANQGLTMNLRVISYAYAPQIFAVVPFGGWCIASIWMLVWKSSVLPPLTERTHGGLLWLFWLQLSCAFALS
jgi:hypothetical protein